MKTTLAIILMVLLAVADLPLTSVQPARADEEAPADIDAQHKGTILMMDITIDPKGKPLGAFQFELVATDNTLKVVGVYAGGNDAFDHDGRPPFYDEGARYGDTDKLIIAEYARPELDNAQLPTTPVTVARISVYIDGPYDPEHPPAFDLNITAAGDAEGNRINLDNIDIDHTLTIPERPES